MRASLFVFLVVLSFTVYFSDLTHAERTDTGMALKSDSSRALRNDKTPVSSDDHRTTNHETEERALINLGRLKKLFQRNSRNVPTLRKNPTTLKELERLESNPAIQKGIKSFKENPEMMRRAKTLSKNPNFVKSLLKAVSFGKDDKLTPNQGVLLLLLSFFGAIGAVTGLYLLVK
ncbi:hypothetical protein F442_14434 [Phytophthora nicotianae P10297]|nr:hypothetical protein PPTG_15045 [Phytophthora nicotianae INRA-310]ETL86674.1 hypothetical protein L917_13927 [Phytophthora nicotianae]ETM39847.1 hypothetical protein L914_14053 [Phytophthora nicotianae]ETN04371.1 hypothetical protein PPTG_15045 [Phytophthora nicotianae INRA-310]ETP37857.1 hypothetical protein F442_14434 [Phytophthora nicotianae P10297]